MIWKFHRDWKKQQGETIVEMELIRRKVQDMSRGDAGNGREEPGNIMPVVPTRLPEFPEASRNGGNFPPELDPKTGTLLFNPSRPLHELNIAAGPGSVWSQIGHMRRHSNSSRMTRAASYDLRSENNRHLSLDTAMTESAEDGERAELAVNSTRSPNSPHAPAAALDVNARGGE